MQECSIILPQNDDAGNTLDDIHADLIEEIVRKVGNCRSKDGISFFRNMKTEKFDCADVFEYTFVVPMDTDIGVSQWLTELAKKYGRLTQQKHIYLKNHLGSVQILDIT